VHPTHTLRACLCRLTNFEHGQPAKVAHDPRRVTEVSGCVCNVDEYGAIRSLSFVIASYAKIGYAITIERLRAKQQQLVERFHGMEEARGSNPLSSTFEFGVISRSD
jgi:hypothetical protein